MSPEEAYVLINMARNLMERQSGLIYDSVIGITQGEVEIPSDKVRNILQQVRQATGTSPDLSADFRLRYELGSALFQNGSTEQAVSELEAAALLSEQNLQVLRKLARAYRSAGRDEEAMDSWSELLSLKPSHREALSQFTSLGTRGAMDWPRIWSVVRRAEPSRQGSSPYRNPELRQILDSIFESDHIIDKNEALDIFRRVDNMTRFGRHLKPSTLHLLSIRFQFDGFFGLGFKLRELSARHRVAGSLGQEIEPKLSVLRDLLKALVYLDQPRVAAEFAATQRRVSSDPASQLRLAKMGADALLMAGEPGPYIEYSELVRADFALPGEDRMLELIRGKRVAVVGPADTGDRLGSMIDDFDVVVRPRYDPEFLASNVRSMGSRTDITYYSGYDMGRFFQTAKLSVLRGDLQLVNARPWSFKQYGDESGQWLRFYRHDYSLFPSGGQLGVQRIVYDLLQFSPREVCIFNSDFYAGDVMFTAGWRSQDRFGPGSHINDIIAVHDLKFDFKFTKSLMDSGVVTAQGRSKEVLGLDVGPYLSAIEHAGVLR